MKDSKELIREIEDSMQEIFPIYNCKVQELLLKIRQIVNSGPDPEHVHLYCKPNQISVSEIWRSYKGINDYYFYPAKEADKYYKSLKSGRDQAVETSSMALTKVAELRKTIFEFKEEIVRLKKRNIDSCNYNQTGREEIVDNWEKTEDALNERTKELFEAQAQIKKFEEDREKRKGLEDGQVILNRRLKKAAREMHNYLINKTMWMDNNSLISDEKKREWEEVIGIREEAFVWTKTSVLEALTNRFDSLTDRVDYLESTHNINRE